MKIAIAILVCLFAGQASAQKTDKTAPKASATEVSLGQAFYSVDDAARLKVRELEFKSDQLEIEIQRLKVKIEEDKQDQAAVWKDLQSFAAQVAKDKNIDPALYDFDAAEVRFTRKKTGK